MWGFEKTDVTMKEARMNIELHLFALAFLANTPSSMRSSKEL